jgi:hypothetical protein
VRKKRVFADRSRPHGTVVLNWHGTPEREFIFFAEAFHLVAQDAVAALRKNPHFSLYGSPVEDFRAYPVAFLYRHALELYMKAVILVGAPMLTIKGIGQINQKELLKNHKLDSIRQDLEKVFDAYEWEWDLGNPRFRSLDDFRKTIAELHSVDARSDAFRYPLNTKGDPSLKSCLRFDLFEFCDVLDSLLAGLQGAAIAAQEELQVTREEMGDGHEWKAENAGHEQDEK